MPAARDRRKWLFPSVEGRFDGIDLDSLDPADEADRAILIRADHPGYTAAAELGRGGETSGQADPRLHLTVHEVVANQIWEHNPPETWQTARRLSSAGYERHEVLHMLASVVAGQVWKMQIDQVPFDPDTYVADLDALPDSWEETSAGWHSGDDLHAPDFPGYEDAVDLGDEDEEGEGEDDLDDLDEIDMIVEAAIGLLAEQGPLSAAELCRLLDTEPDDIDAVLAEPSVVRLADERLAFVPALLASMVFTHRLTGEEASEEAIPFATDMAPALAVMCGDDHLHLADGELATLAEDDTEDLLADDAWLAGPEGWLGGAVGRELVGFRLVSVLNDDSMLPDEAIVDALLELVPVVAEPVVPETLGRQIGASFKRFGDGDGMPVTPLELVCQLAADAPALTTGVLAPLGEVLEQAGFEVRSGHTAPVGTDWDAFFRIQRTASVAVSRGLSAEEGHALVTVCELCRLFGLGRLDEIDRELAGEIGGLLGDPDLAEAFAAATVEHPSETMDFVARVRAAGAGRDRADLAWVESLVAGYAGAVERAETCLREALAVDPDHEEALEDAAWYASDRGDAGRALRFLERMEVDSDEGRTELLRRYAAPIAKMTGVGRNDPCPCGSGRKYKQCCLASGGQAEHPLPDRVRWLWEKMRWWLDRAGHERRVLTATMLLRGGRPVRDDEAFWVDFDIASSLVLFADGAIDDFLRQRGALLPDDERNLAAQWSLADRSVHEITAVRAGVGVTLRDLRTGDIVDVTERKGSLQLAVADLVCAHPVFDGVGYQFVGGIRPIPLQLQQPLMALFDEGAGGLELAGMLGAALRPPALVNMEGDPMILCEATYRVGDAAGAWSQLDGVLERQDDGDWVEFTEIDGRRWMRGSVHLDGDVLTLSANSEARFARLLASVSAAVDGLELLDESRTSPAELMGREPPRGRGVAGAGGMGVAGGGGVPRDAAEAVAAFMREQEERWIDESVPALAGLTPRQAAADPTRREDLLALLHEFDRAPAPNGAVGFDTSRLRALLGMSAE